MNIPTYTTTVQFAPETKEVEVDFILGTQYWDQVLTTAAGLANLQYGFGHLDLDIIVGIVHTEKAASQRVLEKIGMRLIDTKAYFGIACYRYAIERS